MSGAPWALAFLPDGKFLVTERLPGKLRVISPAGASTPPVSGLEALNTGWAQTGLFDLALDPKFNRNHRILFTSFGFDRDEDSQHLGEALKLPSQHEHLRARLEQTLQPLDAVKEVA